MMMARISRVCDLYRTDNMRGYSGKRKIENRRGDKSGREQVKMRYCANDRYGRCGQSDIKEGRKEVHSVSCEEMGE